MNLLFSLSKLALSNLLSYGKQLILVLESEAITALNICAPYIRLKAADASMEASYKFDRKSRYTDDVNAADEKRDKLLKQLFSIVKGFTNSTIIPEANAALLINRAIKHYGTDLPHQPLNAESTNLNGLLLELARSEYTAAIELLKLKGVIALLKESQLDFEMVFYQRGVDKAKVKDTPAASKLRTEYEQAIRGMVEYAEAQVTINADPKWNHVCRLIEIQNAAFEAQIRNRKEEAPAAASTPQNATK